MSSNVWLTVAEAAQHAAMSKDTIYTACEQGEFRHVQVGDWGIGREYMPAGVYRRRRRSGTNGRNR